MRKVCIRIHGLALMLAVLAGMAGEVKAQSVQTLIQFTNTWRYDHSGRDLTDTLWKTNTYIEDATWGPLSRGLLGNEPDTPNLYTAHAPITTTLTVSSTITSYYFRTTFPFTGSTNGLVLIATNLVDDGCVIYLNGLQAGLVRMNANPRATTLATAGPGTEGQLDVVNISPGLLRQGNNLLAVEVHQGSVGSSDVMFGMKLMAFVPTALAITTQPVGDTIAVGDSYTLSVGVSGGPAFYQWFKDNTIIPGATSNTFRINNATLASAGSYQVRVTNSVTTSLFSSPAVVTVVEDTTGPKLVSAVIRDTGQTNQIVVQFTENLQSALFVTNAPVTNVNNYRVTRCGTLNTTVIVSNVSAAANQVQLLVGGPNWNPHDCYYVTVNNIPDSRGNNINPNSVVPVSLPITTNIMQMYDEWDYHSCADPICDPNGPTLLSDQQWYRTNYVVTEFWGRGPGILARESGSDPVVLCAGDQLLTGLSYQAVPSLFRRTFRLPPNAPPTGTLRLRYIVDDGMVMYLNGVQVTNINAPAGPVTTNTKAIARVNNATCSTNTLFVSNLLPGTNWIAVAVVQGTESPTDADTVFGLEMDLITLQTGIAPTNPPAPYQPRFVNNRIGNATTGFKQVISWPTTNYGFALMYSTNIVGSTAAQVRNWWTNEIHWTQVKDQSNPYTNSLPVSPAQGPRRFYKLFRETRN